MNVQNNCEAMAIPSTQVITYSPALTLVPTYECFNRCQYCNFRTEVGASWLSLDSAKTLLISFQDQGICEILILSGEVHPRSPRRLQWIQHISQLCQLALSMGFLTHTNVGPLNLEEMRYLRQTNVSMGLMLEQITPKLLKTVHQQAPSKDPTLRLHQLHQAGYLQIPFTTGLLIGLGETLQDRIDTLKAIGSVHRRYGHIQEVIIQPHRPDPKQTDVFPWQLPDVELDRLLVETVQLAQEYLPSEITIQIPPNLTQLTLACIEAGATDLGGLSIKDHVNPNYPYPSLSQLQTLLKSYCLKPRLPVHSRYLDWVPEPLQPLVAQWQQQLSL